MAAIITFAEQRDGKLRRASLEAVSEARRLASAAGGRVESVLIGAGADPGALAQELASYGADARARLRPAGAGALRHGAVRARPGAGRDRPEGPGAAGPVHCARQGPGSARRGEAGSRPGVGLRGPGGQGRTPGGSPPDVRRQGLRDGAVRGRAPDRDAALERVPPGHARRVAQGGGRLAHRGRVLAGARRGDPRDRRPARSS